MAVSFSISNLSQNQITLSLLSLLAIIAYINPSIVKDLNSTILGRLVTVIIIIYFASKNLVAGLLATLIVIAIMQRSIYQEGVKGMKGADPIKEENKENKQNNRKAKQKHQALTCIDGYTLVKGTCKADGSERGCTKGKYSYCEENAPPAEAEAEAEAEAFQTLEFGEYSTGDQLSNDLSRKAKRSNELVNVSAKSCSDDSVQPSEDVKESFKTRLHFAHFN